MMNDMSLKAKIRNIAHQKGISSQAVLQVYLMNRFLYRLSLSDFTDKFVIKGGLLISSIVGIDQRTTMDLDATLKDLPLTQDEIINAFEKIIKIETDDKIEFELYSIAPIRDDDEYGGYRVSFFANYGKIHAPMSMDVSTGDVITPGASKYLFTNLFDDKNFELWAYPIETVLAEKLETVLSRGTENTRPRDFYDLYVLSSMGYDKETFFKAYVATSKHRNSFESNNNMDNILTTIVESKEMNKRWENYTNLMPYAKGIEFSNTIESIRKMIDEFKY